MPPTTTPPTFTRARQDGRGEDSRSNVEVGSWGHSDNGGQLPFFSLSASSPENLWFLSFNGISVHWDGNAFSQKVLPDSSWREAWVSPTGNGYLAATSGLYRADAGVLTRIDVPEPSEPGFLAVWGTSDSDIWWTKGADAGTELIHYDGTQAAVTANLPWPASGYQTTRGIGGSDVWQVTSAGRLEHFDGSAVSDMTPSSSVVYGVAVAAPNDVWAYGETAIWHFDGTSWSTVDAPSGAISVTGDGVYSTSSGPTGWGSGRICRKP